MDKVWRKQFGEERGHDVRQENHSFGYRGTDEVEGSGKNDDKEDIVY